MLYVSVWVQVDASGSNQYSVVGAAAFSSSSCARARFDVHARMDARPNAAFDSLDYATPPLWCRWDIALINEVAPSFVEYKWNEPRNRELFHLFW